MARYTAALLEMPNVYEARQIGPFLRKGEGEFDVRAFGAVGDGVTDDTNAILEAIHEAKGRGRVVFSGGEGTVYLCRGIDLEDDEFYWITGDGCVLRRADGADRDLFAHVGDGMVNALILDGLVIDGNWQGQTEYRAATFRAAVREAWVRNCVFDNVQDAAVSFPHVSDFALVDGCTFRNGREHSGVQNESTSYFGARTNPNMPTSDRQHIAVTNCAFFGTNPTMPGHGVGGIILSGNTALDEYEGHRITVANNVFQQIGVSALDNKVSSINLYRRAGLSIITGNRILDGRYRGIEVQGSPQTIVANNVIWGHGAGEHEAAIAITNRDSDKTSHRCVVAGNIVSDWDGPGLFAQCPEDYPGRDLIVSHNHFHRVTQFIHLRNHAGTLRIDGNVFDTTTSESSNLADRSFYIVGYQGGSDLREAEIVVANNTIKDAPAGLHFGNFDGVLKLAGNTLRRVGGIAPAVRATRIAGAFVYDSNEVLETHDTNVLSLAQVTASARITNNTVKDAQREGARIFDLDDVGDILFAGNIVEGAVPAQLVSLTACIGRNLISTNIFPDGTTIRKVTGSTAVELNNVGIDLPTE